MNKINILRKTSFARQKGKCYYCQQPMCSNDIIDFADRYQISERQALQLRVTAEHLHARCDGGKNSVKNIVAACYYCNTRRHRCRVAMTPERHFRKVQTRMKRGKWHGITATEILELR